MEVVFLHKFYHVALPKPEDMKKMAYFITKECMCVCMHTYMHMCVKFCGLVVRVLHSQAEDCGSNSQTG